MSQRPGVPRHCVTVVDVELLAVIRGRDQTEGRRIVARPGGQFMKLGTLAIAVALATAPLAAACGEETAEQETSVANAEESTGTEDTEAIEDDLGADEPATEDTAGDEVIEEAVEAEETTE